MFFPYYATLSDALFRKMIGKPPGVQPEELILSRSEFVKQSVDLLERKNSSAQLEYFFKVFSKQGTVLHRDGMLSVF